jgi:hypothetical protein
MIWDVTLIWGFGYMHGSQIWGFGDLLCDLGIYIQLDLGENKMKIKRKWELP